MSTCGPNPNAPRNHDHPKYVRKDKLLAALPDLDQYFEALSTVDYPNATGDGTVHVPSYGNVPVNHGEGLSPTEGVFTAARDGFYMFNASFFMYGINNSHTSLVTAFHTPVRDYTRHYLQAYNCSTSGYLSLDMSISLFMEQGWVIYPLIVVSGWTKTVSMYNGSGLGYGSFSGGLVAPHIKHPLSL